MLTRLPRELRVAPETARRMVEEELMARFRVLQLAADHRADFVAELGSEHVAGGRVYDAHIATVARVGGASVVVTGNRRHFTGLLRHRVRVLTAAELVDEAGW